MNSSTQLAGVVVLSLLGIPVLVQADNESLINYPLDFGITVSPAIEISTRHDDNIFLQDKIGVKSSWITELAPSIKLSAQQGANNYTANYTLKAGRYHSSRNDDYVDHLFKLNSHNEFNLRNKLDLSFDYLKLHERRGTGISDSIIGVSKTPDEYRDLLFKGSYTYGGDQATGRLKFDASHLDKKYTNNRDKTRVFDRKEDGFGGTFFYRIMPKTSMVFEAVYKDIEYINDPAVVAKLDGDEQTYQIGVTWDTTVKTTGVVKIGKTYKNFDANVRDDDDFTSWELGVKWALRSYSVVNITSKSYPSETNGTGNFVRNKLFDISWGHAWSDRLSSTLQTSFRNEDYVDSPRDDDLVFYSAAMDYQFQRTVSFGVNYSYSTRDSNINFQDYTDNTVLFSVKIGM